MSTFVHRHFGVVRARREGFPGCAGTGRPTEGLSLEGADQPLDPLVVRLEMVGRRRGYYYDTGEDALVMEARLDQPKGEAASAGNPRKA